MQITISARDGVLQRFGNQLAAVGDYKARLALARALNYEGAKGLTAVRRAVAGQMRLKAGLMRRAIVPSKAWQGDKAEGSAGKLQYVIRARGGPISLKYWNARELRAGVKSRAPGMEGPHARSFIKGGKWPKGRVELKMGGHAFQRAGAAKRPIEKLVGPAIPNELVRGESAAQFRAMTFRIADRVAHELGRLIT